jgi:hypothetical protein
MIYVVTLKYMGATLSTGFHDRVIAQKAANDLFDAYAKRKSPCKVTIEVVESEDA